MADGARAQERGVSQAWRSPSQRQFCLTSALLSLGGLMGPDLGGGVGSSAGKSRVYIYHMYVCCRETQSFSVFCAIPPRMLIQRNRCRMLRRRVLNSVFKEVLHKNILRRVLIS